MNVKIYETHKQHEQHLIVAQGNVYGARYPQVIYQAQILSHCFRYPLKYLLVDTMNLL